MKVKFGCIGGYIKVMVSFKVKWRALVIPVLWLPKILAILAEFRDF